MGHVWLNIVAMNGTLVDGEILAGGKLMIVGMFGLAVAKEDSGGRPRSKSVSPGTSKMKIFSVVCGFYRELAKAGQCHI